MTSLSLFVFMHWRRKWQPTPVSCLENPRDGGAWWAAVSGVTQSQTRLKRLSSSSSSLSYPGSIFHVSSSPCSQSRNKGNGPGSAESFQAHPSFSPPWASGWSRGERVSDLCALILLSFSVPAPWFRPSPLSDPSRMPGANIHRTFFHHQELLQKEGLFLHRSSAHKRILYTNPIQTLL